MSSEASVPMGISRMEKSPAGLKGVCDFKWIPPAVAKATRLYRSGLVTGVQTGGGVVGANTSERMPGTVVNCDCMFFLLSIAHVFPVHISLLSAVSAPRGNLTRVTQIDFNVIAYRRFCGRQNASQR